jgi:hypothetical protein
VSTESWSLSTFPNPISPRAFADLFDQFIGAEVLRRRGTDISRHRFYRECSALGREELISEGNAGLDELHSMHAKTLANAGAVNREWPWPDLSNAR